MKQSFQGAGLIPADRPINEAENGSEPLIEQSFVEVSFYDENSFFEDEGEENGEPDRNSL